MENERNNRNESESRERGSRGRGRGAMNGPSRGGGRGRGRGGFRGNRFDRERERGPQIDTWTNETAENAEKENSSSSKGFTQCSSTFILKAFALNTNGKIQMEFIENVYVKTLT